MQVELKKQLDDFAKQLEIDEGLTAVRQLIFVALFILIAISWAWFTIVVSGMYLVTTLVIL